MIIFNSLKNPRYTNLDDFILQTEPNQTKQTKKLDNKIKNTRMKFKIHHREVSTNLPTLSIKNLDDWDEKNLKTDKDCWKEQIIMKSNKMIEESSISKMKMKRRLTKNFMQLKAKSMANELSCFTNENAKIVGTPSKNNENGKYNFNMETTQTIPSKEFSKDFNNTKQIGNVAINTEPSTTPFKESPRFVIPRTMNTTRNVQFAQTEYCLTSQTNYTTIQETNISNPIDTLGLLGKLEYFINDEAKLDKEKMHKTEELFINELLKTQQIIQEKHDNLFQIYEKIDSEMKEINRKKEAFSDSKDAINVLLNSTTLNSKESSSKTANKFNQIILTRIKLQMFKTNYEKLEKRFNESLPILKKNISEIKVDIKSYKILRSTLIKESIKYYKSILKTGEDVRGIGLSWVIIKLIELEAKIGENDFPRFISPEFYNYLMIYSIKKIELAKLIEIAKSFKKQHLKTFKIFKTMQSMKAHHLKIESNYGKFTNISKAMKIFNEILRKNEKQILNDNVQVTEDEKVRKKVCKLKEVIYDTEKWENYSNDQMNNTYHVNHKKLFDHIVGNDPDEKNHILHFFLDLNKVIELKEKEISEIKQEFIKKFKKKYLKNKQLGDQVSLNYDTLYSAIFGTCTLA